MQRPHSNRTYAAFIVLAFLILMSALPATDCWAQPSFGGRSGRGGPPGGFDPSSFIERLDRNGNGMIDTDEMEGPARFMIDRMARDNPKIDPSKPISLDQLRKGFEKMRSQRESGRGDSGDDRRRQEEDRQKVDQAMELRTLVPGFDPPEMPTPVMGFGAASELFSVVVTPDDERTAKERMARYDRNRNGYLDKEELTSSWSGNPMDFDRNGDGRLSPAELAVRYAKRRVVEQDVKDQRNQKEKQDKSRRHDRRDEEDKDQFGGRNSYRRQSGETAEGLPAWFTQRDANHDGQVVMAEYASQWNDKLIEEYFRFDMNQDATITQAECLAAVEQGATALTTSGSLTSSYASDSSRSHDSQQSKSSDSWRDKGKDTDRDKGQDRGSRRSMDAKSNTSADQTAGGDVSAKYADHAKRIISANDKNGDGVLTASEWTLMLLNPSGADADKDGRITIDEFARWTQSRARK